MKTYLVQKWAVERISLIFVFGEIGEQPGPTRKNCAYHHQMKPSYVHRLMR